MLLFTQTVFAFLIVNHFSLVLSSHCKYDAIAKSFINTIFQKYSNITDNNNHNNDNADNITVSEFKRLLDNLLIGNVYVQCDEHDESCHGSKFKQNHVNGRKNVMIDSFYKLKTSRERRAIDQKAEKDGKEHADHWKEHIEKCIGPNELLKTYGLNESSVINKDDFFQLCPSLLEQVDNKACLHNHNQRGKHKDDHRGTPLQVWGFGFLSITIISLLSLSVISIIPCLKKSFYHKVMAYLVALAVGTLAGDALLHLIPHAFAQGSNSVLMVEFNEETQMKQHHAQVWRALFVLLGMYVFFTVEQLMKIKAICGGGHGHSHGEKKDDSAEQELEEREKILADEESNSNKLQEVLSCQSDLHESNHPKNQTDIDGHYHADTRHHHHHHGETQITKETKIASVAWMVIVGDGFHNFTDGLAVGVAFSTSMSSGLSTAIAVFCHELPHELGDFAILINSGMTIKQAIVYNLVSAVLAYLGLVAGVFAGEYENGRHFILSITAGLFLYIALADMLPELTQQEVPHQSKWSSFICQHLGIISGISIMLFISLFENVM